jgi:hypothetical protein
MPVHDWKGVNDGVFHHFHHGWIEEISRTLNRMLPSEYYALAEQITGEFGPDVLTLQKPSNGNSKSNGTSKGKSTSGGVALETAPPFVHYHRKSERERYATKAKAVTVRHSSNHNVLAVVEIVSSGNKNAQRPFDAFVAKSVELIRRGIHLLVIDLFPPTSRDPKGIHAAIWSDFEPVDYSAPEDSPLTLASYRADRWPEAFVEPTAVGKPLIDMPLFYDPDYYIPVPLEETYMAAWDAVPEYWRNEIEPLSLHNGNEG